MDITVAKWLESLGLAQYEQAFQDNEIDADVLPSLTAEDLADLGVMIVGHRRKLLNAISALGSAEEAKAEPSSPPKMDDEPPVTEAAGLEAERRQLTVMFCDLVGYTQMSSRLDPEDLRDVMRRYQDAVAGAATRYGGHIAKYLGDGVLVYFGWPQALENQAERAVRAGLACVSAVSEVEGADQTALAARVGIATGQVVVGDLIGESGRDEEAVTGATPNLAARLQHVAGPGQVAVDRVTRRLVGTAFATDDLGLHDLKGFDTPTRVWQVTGEVEAESRFDAAHGSSLARFVGREAEMQLLIDRWELAEGGEGQVVLISGEAGIGKSRLLQGLCDRLSSEDHVRIRYQCSPYHTDSALYPAARHLERAARFAPDDDPEAKLDKLEAMLREAGVHFLADAPLFANLLSLPCEARYGALSMPPHQIKERLLDSLISQLLRFAEKQPVLFLFEDVHWIDPTSTDLFEMVVGQLQRARVLMVVTHRPEWHPSGGSDGHVSSLQLNRLGRRHGAEIVRSIVGDDVKEEVVERIVARTDGVPLFLEELTMSLVETGLDLAEADIPTTLQASLLVRLDRLPPEARHIAQLGAVIGREFTLEMIAAVAPIDGAALSAALEQLVHAELILRKGGAANATYNFKHALVQAAARESLLLSNRRKIHETIAHVMRTDVRTRGHPDPELLAYHLNEAGMGEEAVPYWLEAGRRSARVSANAEAVTHLSRGLAALDALEATPEREAVALDLLFALVSPLAAAKGYSSSEMESAVTRALALCERTDQTARMFPALYGRWSMHHVRGHPTTCLALAEEFLALAQRQTDPVPRAVGHRMIASSCVVGGDAVAARGHLADATRVFQSETGSAMDTSYAQELGVSILCYDAIALALLGFLDQARQCADEAMARARAADHPNTLCFAMWHCGQWLGWILRDREMLDTANRELAIASEEHALPIWESWVPMFAGIVSGWKGRPEQALAELTASLSEMERVQAMLPCTQWHLARAENLVSLGRFGEANAAFDDCLAQIDESGVRWVEPEVHRARHRLALSRPNGSLEEAETLLRCAIVSARSREARLFELRAANDLARLLHKEGKRAAAVALLEPLHSWFTEGFDAPDLVEAAKLLHELH